jgi:hypothetical protein
VGGRAWASEWRSQGTGKLAFKVWHTARHNILEPDRLCDNWMFVHNQLLIAWCFELHSEWCILYGNIQPHPAPQIPDLGRIIMGGHMEVSFLLLAQEPCGSLTSFLAEPVSHARGWHTWLLTSAAVNRARQNKAVLPLVGHNHISK